MIQGTELPLLHRFEFQGLKYLMQIMVQSQYIYRIFFKKGGKKLSLRDNITTKEEAVPLCFLLPPAPLGPLTAPPAQGSQFCSCSGAGML